MNPSRAERLGPVRRAGAVTRSRQRAASSERRRPEPDWEAYARLCRALVGGEPGGDGR